jgi:hypothetical protein
MADERDDEGFNADDRRLLGVLARKPIPFRMAAQERESILCQHDRRETAVAMDRIATALEKRGTRRAWTAKEWAAFFGGLALLIGAIGAQVAMFMK